MFLHFQRWKRRYFKLKGRKLYYAKDTKVIKTDMETLWISCLASILYYPLLNLLNTLKGMLCK